MMRNGNDLHCSCQAYAGYFFVARALEINGTSEMEEFAGSVRTFCQTHWNVVSSSRPTVVKEKAARTSLKL